MATPYLYKGIAVTTVGLLDSPTPTSPNRVTFATGAGSDTEGAPDNAEAAFIHMIKDIGEGQAEAEKLTLEEVRKIVKDNKANDPDGASKKILFVVHGFSTAPEGFLPQMMGHQEKFKKFNLIPVLWPSEGEVNERAYNSDKALSEGAAKAFQSLVPESEQTLTKSILCHSMGNRVLRIFANSGVNFDNIFMVAPDVDGRLFNQNFINGNWFSSGNPEGLEIKNMLTKDKGGKIHVLHRDDDYALEQSSLLNFFNNRLGKVGVKSDDAHPDVKDSIKSVDVLQLEGDRGGDAHNYQFSPAAIDYYESNFV
jgi:esterase/lipase superfamily enzyme